MKVIGSIEEAEQAVGEELGVGEWRLVDQQMIDAFADVTDDHQWIHVDVERAKALTGMDFALINQGRASMLTETWLAGQRVVYGYSGNLFPRLSGKDPAADSLGYYVEGTSIVAPGTGDGAALMAKRLPDWRSIWSSSPGMPSALLAHFAAEAGVHLYGRRGDQILTGPGWLGVHAKCTGELTLSLPVPATVRDAFSGEELGQNTRSFTVTTTRGETRLFKIG